MDSAACPVAKQKNELVSAWAQTYNATIDARFATLYACLDFKKMELKEIVERRSAVQCKKIDIKRQNFNNLLQTLSGPLNLEDLDKIEQHQHVLAQMTACLNDIQRMMPMKVTFCDDGPTHVMSNIKKNIKKINICMSGFNGPLLNLSWPLLIRVVLFLTPCRAAPAQGGKYETDAVLAALRASDFGATVASLSCTCQQFGFPDPLSSERHTFWQTTLRTVCDTDIWKCISIELLWKWLRVKDRRIYRISGHTGCRQQCMGLYVQMDWFVNCQPVFVNKASNWYLYRTTSNWCISKKEYVGKDFGWLINSSKQIFSCNVPVPVLGWSYCTEDLDWRKDDEIVALKV